MRKTILTLMAVASMLFAVPSCTVLDDGSFHFPWADLPIEIGVMYELEEGLYIVVETGDKGGVDVRLVGTGVVNDYIKVVDGGLVVTSPNTGITYQVTTTDEGKIKVMIVADNGKLKVYHPKEVGAAPPVVTPAK
jgi:hypothetical protein